MRRLRTGIPPRLFLPAFLAALLAASSASAQTRYMRVWYIQYVPEGSSSTYGDCQYYEFPGEDGVLDTDDDRNLLIDGGRGGYRYQVLFPFLDGKIGPGGTLWFMALSSAGEDHYDGLRYVVDRYQVKNFYQNLRWPTEAKGGYDDLMKKLDAEGCGPNSAPGHYFEVDAGDHLSGPRCTIGPNDHPYGFDPYVEDRVLAALRGFPSGDDNAYALVHQIRCGESVFLSGGDAYWGGAESGILDENAAYSYPGAAGELADTDFYKVHHHGSNSSSGQRFADAMGAAYAVVQVAYGWGGEGSHAQPAAGSLHRLWNAGTIVYRNDLDGTVLVTCDSEGNYDITRARAYVDEETTPGASGFLVSPPPGIPQNLRVTDSGPSFAELDWDDVAGAYGYDVYRSAISNGDPGGGRHANPGCDATGIYERINSAHVAESRYTDTTVRPGTAYYYRVSSTKVHEASGLRVCYERRYSNEAARLVPTPTPSPTAEPTPTPAPFPTAEPTPGRPSGVELTANAAAFRPGAPIALDGRLTISVWMRIDAYLVADTARGLFSILPGGRILPGIAPLAAGVPHLDAPMGIRLLDGLPCPEGLEGPLWIHLVLLEAGRMPPVRSLAELYEGVPHVVTLHAVTLTILP